MIGEINFSRFSVEVDSRSSQLAGMTGIEIRRVNNECKPFVYTLRREKSECRNMPSTDFENHGVLICLQKIHRELRVV